MFDLYDNGLKALCVVTQEDDTTCELKNIAVYRQYQSQGYGTALIGYIIDYYKGKYDSMILGTGDVPSILSFYQKCEFESSHRIKDFFIDNYDHPIFDEGVQLIDMVYLKKNLK